MDTTYFDTLNRVDGRKPGLLTTCMWGSEHRQGPEAKTRCKHYQEASFAKRCMHYRPETEHCDFRKVS